MIHRSCRPLGQSLLLVSTPPLVAGFVPLIGRGCRAGKPCLTIAVLMDCELCESNGGELLWRNRRCRVVQVVDADYPGFCRVIWNSHVTEMSDLPADERRQLMDVVFAVEQAIRSTLAPDKINLASLGNLTPHLHWHVIPRFADDAHFPSPVWSERRRAGARIAPDMAAPDLATRLHAAVTSAISHLNWGD